MSANRLNPKLATYRALKHLKLLSQNRLARVHPEPVFIFGNQKSGTSVIAALVAAITDLDATIDFTRRELDKPTIPAVHSGRRTIDWFVQRYRSEFSRPIIKEPSITFLAEQILEYWPRSRAVFVIRHPCDNIRSILDRLALPGNLPSIEGFERKHGNKTWETVLDNRWMGIDADHYIEQLARRWVVAARTYQRLEGRSRLIRYEDFEADKICSIKELVRDLGLEPVAPIDDLVDIQYQPAGKRGRSYMDVFGSNLERICCICWPLASEFGFERPTVETNE